MRSRANSFPALRVLVARRRTAARCVALQASRARSSTSGCMAARLSANSCDRMSICESIWAIGFVASGSGKIVGQSDYPTISGPMTMGVGEWPILLTASSISGSVSHRHRARAGAALCRGAHRAARQRNRPQQPVSARSVAGARRTGVPGADRQRRLRRGRTGLSRSHHRHGGNLARLGRGGLELRRALESVRESGWR